MSEESSKKSLPIKPILILLLLLSLAGNAFLASMYLQARNTTAADPTLQAQAELDEVLEQVSKLVNLPEGVTPILATVNNADSLKEQQPFFKDALNGDKLLLYTNAPDPVDRKAFLYRPETNQLINVAPLNIGGNIQAQQDEFSMDIRNGTGSEGLEDQMEALLGRIFPNSNVASKGIAANDEYESSVLVQVNASDELATKVSQLFNVPVEELPADEEVNEDVDLILILGGTGETAEADQTETDTTQEASPAGQQ